MSTRQPNDWFATEQRMWDDMMYEAPSGLADDPHVAFLYDLALFDFDLNREERGYARDALRDYVMDHYGLDFDQMFDWDDWRASYEGSG